MKTFILSLSLVFSCFALANLPEDYSKKDLVDFHNLSINDLPPAEEMVGIIPGDEVEVKLDGSIEIIKRGEEIQLASGGKRCNRRHKRRDCDSSDRDIIVVVPVPVPAPQSYICRSNGFFCHLPYTASVGSYCECYFFGNLIFTGSISSW